MTHEETLHARCPTASCQAVFRLRSEVLSHAMGMVRCPYCKGVFNALSHLVEYDPGAAYQEVPDQLPYESESGKRRGAMRAEDVSPAQFADSLKLDLGSVRDAAKAREAAEAATRALPTEAQYRIPPGTGLLVALRNVLRNRHRTALSLAPICFGVVALIVASGFIDFMKHETRERRIQSHLGHIQVIRPGYLERGEADPFDYLLPETAPVREALEAHPSVVTVSPRQVFSGLISLGDTSLSFLGEGVVPSLEDRLSRHLEMVAGEPLSDERADQVIVGVGLAKNLGVELGQRIVLLTKTETGSLNAVEATVSGFFRTPVKAYDDAYLRTSLTLSNRLTRTQGAHKWVVLLDRTEHTEEVIEAMENRLGDSTEVAFVHWRTLADFYNKTVILFDAQVNVIRLMIALIIVASISNTMIMNVKERTSEIGTLLATGFRRKEVLSIFVKEGVVLGIVGGLLGVALGWAASAAISHVGVPMPPPPGMGFGFIAEVRVTPPVVLVAFFVGVLATIAASIYPARQAASLTIVDALRHSK